MAVHDDALPRCRNVWLIVHAEAVLAQYWLDDLVDVLKRSEAQHTAPHGDSAVAVDFRQRFVHRYHSVVKLLLGFCLALYLDDGTHLVGVDSRIGCDASDDLDQRWRLLDGW